MGLMVNTRWGVPDRASRRRHDRVPQRHVLDPRRTGRRRHPDERAIPASCCAGRSCGSCSRSCTTASRRRDEDVTTAITRHTDAIAVERKRLVVPAEEAAVGKLAAQLSREEPRRDRGRQERQGHRRSTSASGRASVASRKNDDGTHSLFTIDAGLGGLRVRRRREGRQAHADDARRPARVRLRRAVGKGSGCGGARVLSLRVPSRPAMLGHTLHRSGRARGAAARGSCHCGSRPALRCSDTHCTDRGLRGVSGGGVSRAPFRPALLGRAPPAAPPARSRAPR